MTKQVLIKNLKVILAFAFLGSAVWTCFSIFAKPKNVSEEISLTAIPNYQIVSNKSVIPYPAGTVFDQGMAAYFYSVQPEVKVAPSVSINGFDKGLIKGSMDNTVILQAVDDKSQPYWQYTLLKGPQQEFTLSKKTNDVQDQLSFTSEMLEVQVTTAYDRIIQISDELLFQNGLLQMLVISDIHIQGTVNGSSCDKAITLSLPFTLQQTSFSVPKARDTTETITLGGDSSNTVNQNSIVLTIAKHLPQFLLNLLLLFAVLYLGFYEFRNQPESTVAHKRFREWITEGSVDIQDKLQVNVFHLEGLVDLAIDLNKRVIYDKEKARYYVLTEDLVYLFDPERLRSLRDGRQKLGKLLLELGLISTEQLEVGLYYHKKTGSRLGESLIALGFIEEVTLYSTLASQQGLDYYELDPDTEGNYEEWKNNLSIQKARAMMILPLGVRGDGKLVVACGEMYREGLISTLKELFGLEIYMVSSKPSVIFKILDKLDDRERELKAAVNEKEYKETPVDRLSKEEKADFNASYERGKMNQTIFLKAAGIIKEGFMEEALEQKDMLGWLLGTNRIDSETVTLMKGAAQAVSSMEYRLRKDHRLPSLYDVLFNANFLTEKTLNELRREEDLQQVTPEQLLINNYYASQNTIEKVNQLQYILHGILSE